jgi:hypothetical protein
MADSTGLIHLDEAAVPGTHALVIGIGKYPHLAGGQEPAKATDGMRQLSSPQLSAREFAAWLLKEYHLPGKQLASLSLLLSEADPQPFVNPQTKRPKDVAVADISSILAAIKEWKMRGDSSPDNRLIFYFCGHSISESDDMALIAADFDGDGPNPLDQALDLRQLMAGLDKCRASEQVFFIDGCRSSSDTWLSRTGRPYFGQVPLLPCRRPADWPLRQSATYFSTLAGEKSHAIPADVSLFTKALLRGLRGAGSDNPEDVWRVSTGRLLDAIRHFLVQETSAGKLAGVQIPVVREMSTFDLHQLAALPVVPAYVGCKDASANQSAAFACRRQGEIEACAERPADAVDPDDPIAEWAVDLVFDRYAFEALVSGNVLFKLVEVRPPYRRIRLESQK